MANDNGQFNIEVRDTYDRRDHAQITGKQIKEGQDAAFVSGMCLTALLILAGFVFLFVMAMIAR